MRWVVLSAVLSLAFVSATAVAATQRPRVSKIEVDGSTFRVVLEDGRALSGSELVGATLTLKVPNTHHVQVRIEAVSFDQADMKREVILHQIKIQHRDGSWHNVCNPGPDGLQLALPIPGNDGSIELVCSAGAKGKCIRYGYRPWTERAGGPPMRDLYEACVRMVRADYAGNGVGWTRDGTEIDFWDIYGVQQPARVASHSFEAGWTPKGAVCVHHPRRPERLSPEQLVELAPHLGGAVGIACDEGSALAAGAILLNRSAEKPSR
jgi:hypothetical protein